MKTISLKVPDEIYERIEENRKREKKNRTSYVVEAVAEYNKKLEREELRKKLEAESKIANIEYKKYREEIEEWDATLMDGLKDKDDDWS